MQNDRPKKFRNDNLKLNWNAFDKLLQTAFDT